MWRQSRRFLPPQDLNRIVRSIRQTEINILPEMSLSTSSKQTQARELKHRVLTCLHKLSDRDTYGTAASELESIARRLSSEDLPPFLSSISATDSSDKSPVRRQCIRLISVLSEHHGNSLSPHLSKLLSAVVRRLRDSDSSIRSACIAAVMSVSSQVTSPPFTSITKPFLECLFIEEDSNTQTGAALCLATIIDGSRNPDVGSLRKLLPRLEKLAKCESFKAKASVLSLIGSIVGVRGVISDGGKNTIKNVVLCLMEFLTSKDWLARKAAAEAMIKMASAAKVLLSEYKASCLKTFEAKRFDKVKAARETMNQLIEAWKKIPDLQDEDSPLLESQASSKVKASDGRYPPGSKTSVACGAAQATKTNPLDNKGSIVQFPASAPRRRNSLGGHENVTNRALFKKLDRKKPSDFKKLELSALDVSSSMVISDDNLFDGDEMVVKAEDELRTRLAKPEIKKALFNKNYEMQIIGDIKSVPPLDHGGEASVMVSSETRDIHKNQRDFEDLSLIRNQLAQIENQQSHLLELLQRFIGSSQKSIHSLEARVHGLELAIDEISFDLAASTERMSQNATMCCPDFLSSKLWRKTEARFPTPVVPIPRGNASRPGNNRRYHQFRGARGLMMNPLAEMPGSSECTYRI